MSHSVPARFSKIAIAPDRLEREASRILPGCCFSQDDHTGLQPTAAGAMMRPLRLSNRTSTLMTMRQLGETAIKILGMYYAASAFFGVAGLISNVFMPQLEGFPDATQFVVMNLIGFLANATVAAGYLFGGRMLAAAVFSDEAVTCGDLPRRDWLFVGISLMGLVWVLSGAPAIIDAIGKAIWYAEATRQPMFEEAMRRSWDDLITGVVSVLVGIVVVVSARRLSRRLDTES